MPPRVHVDAARTDRSLVKGLPHKGESGPEPVLLLWRRLIDTAVADACKTVWGVPTHAALLARLWIEEHKPDRGDREAWRGSFDCACSWLGLDTNEERRRLSKEIQARLKRAAWDFAQGVARVRRAEALACLGTQPAIARQFVLALVTVEDYELVMGIDRPEKQPRLTDRVDRKRRRAA